MPSPTNLRSSVLGLCALLFGTLFLTGCQSSSSDNNSRHVSDTNSTVPEDQNSSGNDTNATTGDCIDYDDAVARGKRLYVSYCISCHLNDAASGEADIRNTTAEYIAYSLGSVADMMALGYDTMFSDDNISDLAAYLQEIYVNPDIAEEHVCGAELDLTKAYLGSLLFIDPILSNRQTISCSSCHNPAHGFIDARYLDANTTNPVGGALSVGDDGVTLGGRNTPTILYARYSPDFGDYNGTYMGGQFHDGRAPDLQAQAKGPILDPTEMMMPSGTTAALRLYNDNTYRNAFTYVFGDGVFDDLNVAYEAIAEAIAAYEQSDLFAPFDSRYDRSKLDPADADYYAMTPLEQTGYELFFSDTLRCKVCHTVSGEEQPAKERFTDHKYHNIGRPKNVAALIARNGSTDYTDNGLGARADINDTAYYGLTKTPTLRNIAVTGPYMNNGVFHHLETVLAFYDHMSAEGTHTRNPETNADWAAPEVNATVAYPLLESSAAIPDEDIEALIAFLKLLTDSRYEALLDD